MRVALSLSFISLLDPSKNNLRQDTNAKTISFFCKQRPVKINSDTIRELKIVSKQNNGANVRVCLHENPESNHHDMVILECPGKYYRPHRHEYKGDSFHVMEGAMGLFTFDDNGLVIDAVTLGVGDIYRVEVGMYHAVLPLSNPTIYHENKPGPFLGDEDSLFPDWAPSGENQAEIDKYLFFLKQKLTD